jgi:hypothetical protein
MTLCVVIDDFVFSGCSRSSSFFKLCNDGRFEIRIMIFSKHDDLKQREPRSIEYDLWLPSLDSRPISLRVTISQIVWVLRSRKTIVLNDRN